MDDSNKLNYDLIKERVTLRESAKTYELYLDAMGDALMVLDPQRKVMAVNMAAVELWGYDTKEAMLNLPIALLFPERTLNKHRVEMERAVKTGTVRPFETVALTRDKKEIPVMLSGTAMKDAEGNQKGYVGVFRDITQLKQLEQLVKHITEMEREKLRCDLHDSTSQMLVAAKYLAASLTRRLSATHPEAAANATEIERIIGEAQVSIREVADGLKPLTAGPGALGAALCELAVRTKDMYGIPCQFTAREPVLIENPEVATQLYLIAQEAVANATEHAKASTIEVSLSERDGAVRLVVRDDGVGYSAGILNEGIGVGIMRSRSEKIGASLDLGPGKTGGTAVTCVWKSTPPPD